MTTCDKDFCLRYCNRASRRACDRKCGRSKCYDSQQYQIYKIARGIVAAAEQLGVEEWQLPAREMSENFEAML